ncbi:MAG: exosortase C-terminal domain/associated protein EpsI, partial [Gammaproteobacteria bacterium]
NYRGIESIVDHIMLGYIVFGIVLLVALAVGSRFTDIEASEESPGKMGSSSLGSLPVWYAVLASGVILTIGLSISPAVNAIHMRMQNYPMPPPIQLPAARASWVGPLAARPDWAPRFNGYEEQRLGRYSRGSAVVDVGMVSYWQQMQGAELINSSNRLFDVERWTQLRVLQGALELPAGDTLEYREFELQDAYGDRRVVRYWYVIDGEPRIQPLRIKLQELLNSLLGRPTSANLVAVSAPFVEDPGPARQSLDAFVRDVYAN